MPQGKETSPEVVAQFRAHYLYSGNASESAEEVGIPERTGRDIAKRLSEDESFAADRRALRTRALDELVAMRMRVAKKALERYEADDLDIAGADGEHVTVIDKRADHGRLVMDAEKNAHHLAKLESAGGENAAGKTEVHVHLKGVTAEEPEAADG